VIVLAMGFLLSFQPNYTYESPKACAMFWFYQTSNDVMIFIIMKKVKQALLITVNVILVVAFVGLIGWLILTKSAGNCQYYGRGGAEVHCE